jgi:hypothetical protein
MLGVMFARDMWTLNDAVGNGVSSYFRYALDQCTHILVFYDLVHLIGLLLGVRLMLQFSIYDFPYRHTTYALSSNG